jgi:hypothetical protein
MAEGVTLLAPVGALTSWSNTFSWTSVSGGEKYLLEVYDTNSGVRIYRAWINASTAGCASGGTCMVSPSALAALANGDYQWRIRDYGSYGYGPYTPFATFNLNQ